MKLLDSPPIVEQSMKQVQNRQDPQCMRLRNVIPIESQHMGSLTEKFISSFRTCGLKACSSAPGPDLTRVKNEHKPLTLIYQAYIGIKYYPSDPTIIADEQTRYQIFMQVRNDLISGRMQVDENLFITLCGLILQSDCGDYGSDRLGSNYIKQLLKLPNLSEQLEKRIKAKHEDCRCRQPALVEYQLLDKVKQLPTYGQIRFHVKETISNTSCLLCLGPTGVNIEDSRKNLIQFLWQQITGFGHKHKQILIKILNEGTRFTYRCSVDTSEMCNSLLRTCKNYLNFYRNEISQRIMDEPHQSMMNTNIVQSVGYNNSSLDNNQSSFTGNEPNLLHESKYSAHVTDPVRLVPSINETDNCKSNHNVRPFHSSLIGFSPGCEMKSLIPFNTNTTHAFMCSTDSHNSQYHHRHHHHHPHYCCDSNTSDPYYHHYYQYSPVPVNPYHVRGTSGVFHRPRGCETVTDIGDHPHIFANRRSHCPSYNHTRWIVNDTNELKLKHRRRSFPKTKYYFIEEDLNENQLFQDHHSFTPASYPDDSQSHQSRSNSLARSSVCREFHQLDALPTDSLFKSSSQGRPTGNVLKRNHRILPRPVSRLDRYPEHCSSLTTTESQETIENHENCDDTLHNANVDNIYNDNNTILLKKFNKSIKNTIDKSKANRVIEVSVAQLPSTSNSVTNRNESSIETRGLIQVCSNEPGQQNNVLCNSSRGYPVNSSKRYMNGKSVVSSSPRPSTSIGRSNLYSDACESRNAPDNQSDSYCFLVRNKISKEDIDDGYRGHHQHHQSNVYSAQEEREVEEGDNEESTNNNVNNNAYVDEDNDENLKGLTDVEHDLFNIHQYATTTNTTSTPPDTSFCSSLMYCAEDSQTPSLLKNSDINSELCESFSTSLIEFQLPPTPNSSNNQDRITANERVEEYNSDSNLPSPPSNDFLYQLRKCKLDNEKHSLTTNLEDVNCHLTTIENISNDTGFSSRSENKRSRRLPLLPYERSAQMPVDVDRQITVPTVTSTAMVKATMSPISVKPVRTESLKTSRPKMTPFLSPTPSPRMSKIIGSHQQKLPFTDPSQEVNKLEAISHPEEVSECDLV
ncbi:Tyrosine-protein phosphatase non-receptor type 4 [Schistosoma japonicum]|nr:Tyrosine-protein phosphatase non-receptor type 4 [Schistosoma japonicum]